MRLARLWTASPPLRPVALGHTTDRAARHRRCL